MVTDVRLPVFGGEGNSRHADPRPPDAVALRTRQARFHRNGSGRYWNGILRGEDIVCRANILQGQSGGIGQEPWRSGEDCAGQAGKPGSCRGW